MLNGIHTAIQCGGESRRTEQTSILSNQNSHKIGLEFNYIFNFDKMTLTLQSDTHKKMSEDYFRKEDVFKVESLR